MKKCVQCYEIKELSEFPVRKDSSDGYRNNCKICKALNDSKAHLKRMSTTEAKLKENLRAKTARDSRSDEKKKADLDASNEKSRISRDKEKQKFFDENGCDYKEFSRRQKERQFLTDSKLAHKEDHYSYHLMKFVNITTVVEIWCNVHQKSFWQLAKDHKRGRGCVECGKIATGDALRKSQEDFIRDAEEFCGNKFTFQDAIYKSYSEVLQVTCKEHGNFPISPANLFNGKGCPDCAKFGYRTNIPGYLYIMGNGDITKIGITNRTPELRAKDINKKKPGFEVLYSHYYDDGAIPLAIETSLLWVLPLQYGRVQEVFDGSTECFLNVGRENLIYIATKSGENLERYSDTRPELTCGDDSITNC